MLRKALILVSLGFAGFSSQTLAAEELVYRSWFLKFSPCQKTQSDASIQGLLDSVNPVLKKLTGETVGSPDLNSAESLFYANNPSLLAVGKTSEAVENLIQEYCTGYRDQTALNAVLHFAVAATVTFYSGESSAKKMMDLHEAGAASYEGAKSNLPGNRLLDVSAMDVFNNYQGIRFARGLRGFPQGSFPARYFVEQGLRLEREGKLRSIKAAAQPQVCLVPKEAMGRPPHKDLFGRAEDKEVKKYYEVYRPSLLPLKEEDKAAVIQIPAQMEADPLFQELNQYAQLMLCCT